MPDNNFDLQSWLSGLELTPEQKDTVTTALSGEKNAQRLREDFLRQADYSRRMNELRDAKQKAETEYTRQYGDLAKWKAQADQEIEAERQAKATALARAAALEAAAQEYGLDTSGITAATVGAPITQPNTKIGAQAPVDLSGYEEKFNAVSQELAASPLINAKMADIAAEYEELHGKRFRGMTDFVQEAITSGKSLDVLAEEKYQFTAKRQEVEAQRVKDREDQLVRETEARVRSELNLPSARPADYRSPITFANQSPAADARPDGVSAAVAAFNEGKYRQGV